MDQDSILRREEALLLLAAADGDGALLLLALRTGLPAPLPPERLRAAQETLTRLGLTAPQKTPLPAGEPPVYSMQTIHAALDDKAFQSLLGEVQRLLGRIIPTEELRSLLCIRDHLQMPDEVTAILVNYCIQRCRAAGRRMPSLREIEREAFRWADQGVNTVETAAAHVKRLLEYQSRRGRLMGILQLDRRSLVKSEEAYLDRWISWGFGDDAIALAYEKTCLNAGGLRWPYMNSILQSWQEQGLHTVAEIRQGDHGGKKPAAPKRKMGSLEQKAIDKLLKEE